MEDAPKQTIVFLCQRGGAKSVMAASYFNRIAERTGLPFVAEAAAAEEPYAEVLAPVVRLLDDEGIDVASYKPRRVEESDLRDAERIVGVDCNLDGLTLDPDSVVERWDDVPKVGEDLEGSAAAIRRHVEALAAELKASSGKGQPALSAFVAYFLRLGTIGFGGPIALAGAMQRDLVETRGWVTREQYIKGLALAQLAPGPLAAQLAIYLGWARSGLLGATLVAIAFVLPSFLMVMAISVAYVRFGGLVWMQAAFYGIGAAVIAIILRSAYKLVRLTLRKDSLRWTIFAVNAVATAVLEAEVISLIVGSGLVALLVENWKSRAPATLSAVAPLAVAATASAVPATNTSLFWFFVKAGAFVFGSGLAIVPFLYGGVVGQHRWLTDQQFLDAVAVAMITPGPVVITVAFIGYLVDGFSGAVLASLGVFLPCYLLVILPAPFFERFAENARLKSVIDGVTAAATGAIAGAVWVLARRAIIDIPTVLIFAATLACLIWLKKIPEPVVIAVVGIASVLLAA
jgi:chromate transporter